jgi:hypothetical protein
MLYLSLIICAAAWIHLSIAGVSGKRYFFPVVLMMLPCGALGLLTISVHCLRLATGWHALKGRGWLTRNCAAAAPAVVAAVVMLASLAAGDFRFRAAKAELGRWIARHCDAGPVLSGPYGMTSVVSYYARGTCRPFPGDAPKEIVKETIREGKANIVLLTKERAEGSDGGDLLAWLKVRRFTPVAAAQLPPASERVLVLVRRPRKSPSPQTAGHPPRPENLARNFR